VDDRVHGSSHNCLDEQCAPGFARASMLHRLANLAFVVVVVPLSAACTTSSPGQVTVENNEPNPLFSLYFDPVGSDTSTVNLLGAHQLFPGTKLVLSAECGTYDVVAAQAGGDQLPGAGMCVIRDQDVCASGTYVISTANCQLQ
jgi:hypothetical protein